MSTDTLHRINLFETGANVLTLVCALVFLLSIVVIFLPERTCKRIFVYIWVISLLLPALAQVSHALYAKSARAGLKIPITALWNVDQEKVSAKTILRLDRASYRLISGGANGGLLPPHVNLNQIEGLESIPDSNRANDAPRIWLMDAQIDYLHLGLRKVGMIKPKPGNGLWIGALEGIPAGELDTVDVGDHP